MKKLMNNTKMKTPHPLRAVLAGVRMLFTGGTALYDLGCCKPNIFPAVLVALALLLGVIERSQSDLVVLSPGAIVGGKTIAEWSAAWWQWAVALAPPGDPFTDTGASGFFQLVKP
jgi:hypothetical protein